MHRRTFQAALSVSALALIVPAVTPGCPSNGSEIGFAKVTTMFTLDSQKLSSAIIGQIADKLGPVPVEDIESLRITITEIVLDYDGDAGDMEDGGSENGNSKIVVFQGSEEVDLLQLEGVNQLISLDEAPAGDYTKIRIRFENPVLVLKSDTEQELTNIQVTANGNLFVSQTFNLPEGQNSVLLIDFGGVHLVMLGNGDFVLTPQLAVALTVGMIEDAMLTGTITAIDVDQDLFTLEVNGGVYTVDYAAALIFLADDTDAANGTEGDLAVGQMVEVAGALFPDDVVEAESVRILPEPEPEPEM